MASYKFISLCIVVAICAYYYSKDTLKKLNSAADPLLLAVGILSARENFELRNAARSTWLKEYLPRKNNVTKAWFVIGKDDCQIPPMYRLNKYACEKWNVDKIGLRDVFYTAHEIAYTDYPNPEKALIQGFSFKVNHPVIVRRLGVLFSLLAKNFEAKVAILDIQTKEIVVQTKITQNSLHIGNGYLYEDVETVLLPKNYEGMVVVEGFLKTETWSHILWDDGGHLITFNRLYLSQSHVESIPFSNQSFSAASIQFVVDDMKDLKSMLSHEEAVTSEWIKNLKKLNEKLLIESKAENDIVFVDVMDTYRNLPSKLLHFYNWLDNHYEFMYALKSDDDSVIDISHLIQILKKESKFKTDGHWIWSRFRHDWPVNYIGKWTDYDYRSSSYPSFPCGAAYVMPQKTVLWLSYNIKDLFPYQGEDVSMGIWLSAIKPHFIDDSNFECDSKCKEWSYNRAQLTADKIHKVWSLHEKCKNLCFCE